MPGYTYTLLPFGGVALKPVLVCDANVLIDLEAADLTPKLFHTQYEFVISEAVFREELAPTYPHFVQYPFRIVAETPDGMHTMMKLMQRYAQNLSTTAPSRLDCVALATAKILNTTLLTGDQRLRLAAIKEQVDVHGTIWMVEELIRQTIIDVTEARDAYAAMKQAKSRLPWDQAEKRLKEMMSKGAG